MTRGRTFGVKDLPRAFKRVESLSMAYFEASLVVEHLVQLNGDAGLQTLLKAYAERATDEQAFARAFGRSVDDVDASFRKFADATYGAMARALAEPAAKPDPENLAALRDLGGKHPDNFLVQNALGQALYKAGDYAGARTALERAATLAPQASGSASPRALLADIARRQGDEARQRRELRALLTWDHTNIVAARQLAELAAAAKATDDEDFALRLIADLDPFDPTAHSALGRRLLTKGQYADALIEFKAAVAVGPANLAEAHADVAEASLKAGKVEDARHHAFLALKIAPNYARAQDLYLAAGKGRE
jgi:tetratricopeptide (TPR) repeat protein